MSKTSERKVTIVVPVYADWPSLKDCIESLKQYVGAEHKVILVNDCGPEADELEKKIKKAIDGTENFEYYRNKRNMGFLKTCNRAVLEIDRTQNDVLLLNSDTKVTEGFLEELMSVLASSNKIGAVSPRTNNATIATIPLSAMRQKGINPKKSYKMFLKKKIKMPRYVEVPTAHGFCILLRRNLINKYGLFDEIFGKGYGEEVDFCMRIRKHGYKSVLSNRSYVFHLEAKSFTPEAKIPLLKASSEIINSRYPEYSKLVGDYERRALALEEGIDPEKGLVYSGGLKGNLRKLIERNKKVHSLVKKINAQVRQKGE